MDTHVQVEMDILLIQSIRRIDESGGYCTKIMKLLQRPAGQWHELWRLCRAAYLSAVS